MGFFNAHGALFFLRKKSAFKISMLHGASPGILLGDGPMRRIQGKALLIVLDKALFPLGLEDAGNRDLMQPQPLAYGYVGHTKA